MKEEHIHLLEKLGLTGELCDGRKDITKGFYMRGGRKMDNHFECMWDMFRSVPSIETPNVSVLDEYYWLNKHDPNYSLFRAKKDCGKDAHTDKMFKLNKESAMELCILFILELIILFVVYLISIIKFLLKKDLFYDKFLKVNILSTIKVDKREN